MKLSKRLNEFPTSDGSQTPIEKLTNYANAQYVGRVGLGTPETFYDVVFDSGSADFWVQDLKRESSRETFYDVVFDSKIGSQTPHHSGVMCLTSGSNIFSPQPGSET